MEPTPQTHLNGTQSTGPKTPLMQYSGEGNKKLNKAIESHVTYLLEAAPAQTRNREGEFLDAVQLNRQDWHRKEK